MAIRFIFAPDLLASLRWYADVLNLPAEAMQAAPRRFGCPIRIAWCFPSRPARGRIYSRLRPLPPSGSVLSTAHWYRAKTRGG